MNTEWMLRPFGALHEAAGLVVGRLALLAVTLGAASYCGSLLALFRRDDPVALSDLGTCLLTSLIYPVMVIGGIMQVCGFFIYSAIAAFAFLYVRLELPHRWLAVPFLLQAFETWRWVSSIQA